jgi:hypothetical protein
MQFSGQFLAKEQPHEVRHCGAQRFHSGGAERFGRDLTQWDDLVSVKVGDPDRDVLFVRRRLNRPAV